MNDLSDPYAVAEAKLCKWGRRIGASDLKPRTRHVLHVVGFLTYSPDRSGLPSVAELPELIGLTERTVRRHLALAQDAGWLSIKDDGAVAISDGNEGTL